MNRSILFSGIAIMIGLAVSGAMLPKAMKVLKSYDRTVSVKGLCERETKADKAIWPIKFKAVGNDLESVGRQVENKNAFIRNFLLKGGIKAEEISFSTISVSDKLAQEYGNNERAFRYVANCVVTVCTADVDKVIALNSRQMELIKEGIAPENEWDARCQYYFEGLNELKPEMIEEATRNAREVAVKFAQDSDSRLGKIKQAGQGTFSIEDRDSNTPYIKRVRVVTNVVYYLEK